MHLNSKFILWFRFFGIIFDVICRTPDLTDWEKQDSFLYIICKQNKTAYLGVKPWPNDYTFLSTFAIHLYCKNRAMYCVVAKRLDISLYNLFDFPT